MTNTEQIVTHPTTQRPVLRIVREERDNGSMLARTFRPKAIRHTHYFSFKDAERREQWIVQQIASALASETAKQERKATRDQFKHGYKVGDLLHGSWGYDQTNCEFYQVIRTTERTIVVREIGATPVEGSEGFMSQSLTPNRDTMYGPEIRAVVRPGWNGNGKSKGYCTIGHASCSETSETQAHYSSWYA